MLYACISEECVEPPQLFPHFDKWVKHMEDEHSIRWTEEIHKPINWCCDTGHEEQFFNDQALFDNHIETHHQDLNTVDEVAELRDWGEIRRPRPPYTCPICSCVPDDIATIAPWLIQNSMLMHNLERPHNTTEDIDDELRSRLSRHIASHLIGLGFMSIAYLDDSEDGSEASRVASDGASENTPLSGGEMEADYLQFEQDVWDYEAPVPVTPLDENIFELDWIRVKDLSDGLGAQDSAPEDLEKEIIATISEILAVDPDGDDFPRRIEHLLQLSRTQYEQFGKLKDLVRPVKVLSNVLESISPTNPNRGHYARDLGLLCFQRASMRGGYIPISDPATRKTTSVLESMGGVPDRAELSNILLDYFWLRSTKSQVQSR
ncbi:hypothetical protein HG530_001561 [Fusarium avenaceum]|nr:hypothetical protein HG530_001561 [Fusarium avenaceum]